MLIAVTNNENKDQAHLVTKKYLKKISLCAYLSAIEHQLTEVCDHLTGLEEFQARALLQLQMTSPDQVR